MRPRSDSPAKRSEVGESRVATFQAYMGIPKGRSPLASVVSGDETTNEKKLVKKINKELWFDYAHHERID